VSGWIDHLDNTKPVGPNGEDISNIIELRASRKRGRPYTTSEPMDVVNFRAPRSIISAVDEAVHTLEPRIFKTPSEFWREAGHQLLEKLHEEHAIDLAKYHEQLRHYELLEIQEQETRDEQDLELFETLLTRYRKIGNSQGIALLRSQAIARINETKFTKPAFAASIHALFKSFPEFAEVEI